ncbi:MAG: guanylate kinase [Candidatus Dormibacteraeota bacterium]|nr:guanylate kinase [Candidatus Dormibacteraeota bacterium]
MIVISGPGGVGKDTLIEMLRGRHPRLTYAVSYTTRPRRDYERDGVHYSFVGEGEFEQLARDGRLLEHALVNGHRYGTSAERVDAALARGEDVILKIDVQGAEQVRARRPDGLYFFVAPPSMDELNRRRRRRGDTPAESDERQRLAEREMAARESYDHVVVNDDAHRAVAEIESILHLDAVDADRAG